MGRDEGGRGHSYSSSYALSLTHAHTCARLHPVAYPRPLPLTNLTHTIHALGHSLALSPPSLSHSLTRLLPHSLAQTRHSLEHASPRATSPHLLTHSPRPRPPSPLLDSLSHPRTLTLPHAHLCTHSRSRALAHTYLLTYSFTHPHTQPLAAPDVASLTHLLTEPPCLALSPFHLFAHPHTPTRSLIRLHTHIHTQLFINLPTHSITQSLMHSRTRPPRTHSRIHPHLFPPPTPTLTNSLTHVLASYILPPLTCLRTGLLTPSANRLTHRTRSAYSPIHSLTHCSTSLHIHSHTYHAPHSPHPLTHALGNSHSYGFILMPSHSLTHPLSHSHLPTYPRTYIPLTDLIVHALCPTVTY